MTKRISTILSVGAALVAVTAFGSRYLIMKNRPQANEERQAERVVRDAEFSAQMRQDFKDAIAATKNEKVRKLYEYEFRIFEHEEKLLSRASLVDVRDGIDDFEALVIAKEYFNWQFGVCGFVQLPERKGDTWVVTDLAGRGSETEPPIIIDAKTGAIQCAGHPSISDVVSFMRSPKPPNHFPEPTPGAVH